MPFGAGTGAVWTATTRVTVHPDGTAPVPEDVPVSHARRTRALVVATLGASMAVLVAAPAAAHVTANPSATEAGGRAIIDFRVPHGCGGEATEVLEIAIPDGVVNVKPEQVAGWDVDTEFSAYDEPVELHGDEVTEGVSLVTYTAQDGNALPDDQFRSFGLSVVYPDGVGDELRFPSVQTCVDGSEEAWVEVSDDPDAELDYPAPSLTLTAAAEDGHGDDATEAPATDEADEQATAVESTPASADTGAPVHPVTYAALAAGLLGLVVGGLGLRAARR